MRLRPLPCVALASLALGCSSAPRPELRASAEASRVAPPARGGPAHVDLSGEWKYLPYDGEGNMAAADIDDTRWPSMSLPSSWFLMGRKQYPPKATAVRAPFGDNAPGALWPVDPDAGLDYSGTVWFRRTIDWEGSAIASRPVIVDLDMVDYYAEVFVNGVSVGRHEGYFQRWSVDATKAIRRGRNVLALKVSAPALAFDMSQQYAVSWPKMQNQIKGIFAYHDTRPGATSARGQERSTGGVLRGIAIRESPGVDLEELLVLPRDVSEASARLVIDATVRNWTSAAVDVALDGVVAPSNFEGPQAATIHATAKAPPGESHLRTEVTVRDPRLWWSWDYGKPNLYQLDARLHEDDGESARAARFGIRSIERDADWVFRLNGQRIYPRGTNYIATQWLSQADRDFYARDLRLALDAHLNSIRVHAHLERPEFYDLADELGIMVWQDFPLQWGYTDLPSFHAEALRQAEDMVRQYGDHPSILVWSMHNESPYAMAWMKRRDPDQNRALDDALAALARRDDPSRVVHRDSGTGDGHYYYGWYDGQLDDAAKAKEAPFVTEYGAEALPGAETLRTMFDANTIWPRTASDWEDWKFADFQPKTAFDVARVQQGDDLGAFVRNSQRYQATLLRYTTELLRRRKWAGNTGIYQFMFVDDWPAITWSVLDYYRRPKLGYAAMQSAMQELLPSIAYDPQDPSAPLSIYVVNDRLSALPRAHVSWRVTGATDATPAGDRSVDVPADAVIEVADLGPIPALADSGARLDVRITSASGEPLAESHLGAEDFLEGRTTRSRKAGRGD